MKQISGFFYLTNISDTIAFFVFLLLFLLCYCKSKKLEKNQPWELLLLAILLLFLVQKDIVIGKLTINIKIPLWTIILFFLIWHRNNLSVYYININKLIRNIIWGIIPAIVIFGIYMLYLHCNRNNFIPFELFNNLNFAIFAWVFFVAIKEEILFRGIVQGCLLEFDFTESHSILIQAMMFSIVHIYYIFSGRWYNLIYIFIFGLLVGFITIKRKNLIPAILIHFTINICIISYNIAIFKPFGY